MVVREEVEGKGEAEREAATTNRRQESESQHLQSEEVSAAGHDLHLVQQLLTAGGRASFHQPRLEEVLDDGRGKEGERKEGGER